MVSAVREAILADVPQIAEVFAAGFIDDDVFGRYMHPWRRQYPEDWLKYWHNDIKDHLVDPQVLPYVCTDDTGTIKAACILRRLGKGGEMRATKSATPEGMQAHGSNKDDDVTWTDRSADPEALKAFDKNWDDIKEHFTGAREESWMIEMFCVAPDAQKRGNGRQLILKAIDVCKAEEPTVPLCVISSQIGDAFYEKMGFREVGRANVGDMSGVVGGSIKFYESHLY